MGAETSKTLMVLVSQSFDVFNQYGKDPESLKSTYKAFEIDLAGHSAESIQNAFTEWRKTKSTMPTPADILNLLNFNPIPLRRSPELTYDPPDYHYREARREQRESGKVYWVGQSWPAMTEQTKSDVIRHIRQLASVDKTKAENYCKFLISMCDAPKDLPKEIGQ